MKKILKPLLLFTILFIGIIKVNAASDIKYDFGRYLQYEGKYGGQVLDVVETEDGYKLLGNTSGNQDTLVLEYLNNENEIINRKEISPDTYYSGCVLVNDVINCAFYDYSSGDEKLYFDIYDNDLKKINTIESTSLLIFNGSSLLKAENDKYYIIGFNVFDKKTNSLANMDEILVNNQYYDEFQEAQQNDDEEKIKEYLQKIYEEEFYNTYIPTMMKIMMTDNIDYLINNEIIRIAYNDTKIAISYYNEDENQFGVIVFNENAEKIYDELITNVSVPVVLLSDNYFYIIEYIVDGIVDDSGYDNIYSAYYEITQYNYNGKKETTKKLSSVISVHDADNNNDEYRYGRKLEQAILTRDGFVLLTNFYQIEKSFDPTINEDDTIDRKTPTFQKYYFTHPIDVKTDGNGKVDVIENSRYGEKVSFVITPNEGYQIDLIKVTDSDGNVITFTDYTFTMPSADVTIEVSFVEEVKNSETSDAIIYSAIAILIGISFIIYNNKKKINWFDK